MKDQSEIPTLRRPVGESDHVLGPPSAPATLVEYGDYECLYCRQLHPLIKEVVQRVEGLRFVYRHFPLSGVHPHAAKAAEAAEAASAQGRFWEMHDALFEDDRPLDDERLARAAGKAGLDMARYGREMAEGVYAAGVEAGFNSALYGGGVTGTPTLYLNGALLSSVRGVEGLLAAVTGAGGELRASHGEERGGWLDRLRHIRLGMTRLRP